MTTHELKSILQYMAHYVDSVIASPRTTRKEVQIAAVFTRTIKEVNDILRGDEK